MLFAAALAVGPVLSAGTPVDRSDTGFNPFGIIALGAGLLVLIILLITFRRR